MEFVKFSEKILFNIVHVCIRTQWLMEPTPVISFSGFAPARRYENLCMLCSGANCTLYWQLTPGRRTFSWIGSCCLLSSSSCHAWAREQQPEESPMAAAACSAASAGHLARSHPLWSMQMTRPEAVFKHQRSEYQHQSPSGPRGHGRKHANQQLLKVDSRSCLFV